ncbi:gag/pol protein [Cucumis melo var. makuwa]|nr:gag/pol protein [Cucumis melo var. makuwa]
MFGQPKWSLRHEALKYIYTKRMKEGTSVREHVLDMMMHFNITEVNGGAIDEANQNKSDSLEKFKEYKAEVENESAERCIRKKKLNFVRHGSLYDEFCSVARFFLGYALETVIYILNNVPSKSVSETPYELWKGRKGSLRHFRIWGCPAHVLVQNPKKLEHRSKLCLFVGYSKESKGGLFYDPQENKVFVSTNATFLEEDHIRNHQTRSKLVLEEIFKNATDRPSSSTKVVDKTRNIGLTHPSQEFGEPRRSGRVVRQPDRYLGLSEAQIIIPDDGIEDPLTYKQAMNDVDCDQWIKTMDLEMESMYSNSVWTLVDQPNDMDVKTVFLNGNLEESIYMVQPEGFIQNGQEQKNVDEPCVYKRIINNTIAFLILPDIFYSMGIVSRYQSNPDVIIGQPKCTSGSVFTLNGGAVVWRSIKQSCIADPTMEVEYVAAYEAAKEAV